MLQNWEWFLAIFYQGQHLLPGLTTIIRVGFSQSKAGVKSLGFVCQTNTSKSLCVLCRALSRVQGRFTVVSCQRVSTSKYHTLGNKALRGRIFPTWTLFFLAENRENTFKAGKSSLTRQELDQHSLEEILFRELIASLSVVSVRFGSVSVSSICYRPGSVHVRFRFLRFLVDFGSVRFGSVFGTFCIDICFFFPASERQIQIASRNWFHEQRLSKSGES